MKYILAAVLQLSIVPAQACHPYVNKWSQGCAWSHSHSIRYRATTDHDWYVEIIKMPNERDEAIQKLKEQFNPH